MLLLHGFCIKVASYFVHVMKETLIKFTNMELYFFIGNANVDLVSEGSFYGNLQDETYITVYLIY